jgi:cysteine desulfurase / selenocysteine lyase
MKKKLIYCNWAATSAKKLYGNINDTMGTFTTVRSGISPHESSMPVREYIAKLFHFPSPNRVIFGSGTTDLLNKIILGYFLKRSGSVITSIYDHNSVLRPLNYLKLRKGIKMKVIEPGNDGIINEKTFQRYLEPDTVLAVINHASNVTGIIQPIAPIVQAAHDKGIPVILDCAQSGGVVPIDYSSIKADAMVFSGHKSLMGPSGIGFALMRDGFEIEPVFSGGSGIKSELEFQPEEMPYKLEPGTPNYEGIVLLGRSLKKHAELSIMQKLSSIRDTFTSFLKKIEKIEGVDLALPKDTPQNTHSLAIASLVFDQFNAEEASFILRKSFNIITRPGLHCAPLCHRYLGTWPHGTVRFSFGYKNTESDFEIVLKAIKTMTSGKEYEIQDQ